MVAVVAGGRFGTGAEIDEQPTIQGLAKLPSGGFAVIWTMPSYNGSLFAAIHDADGRQIGAATRLSDSATAPDIVALSTGGFAVAWGEGSFSSAVIKSQVFDAAGVAFGTAATISEPMPGSASLNLPSLAALPNGNFIATWGTGNTVTARDIVIRVIDGGGTPISSSVTLSAIDFTSSNDAAVLADGRILVSYAYATGTGEVRPSGVRVAIFDPATNRITDDDFIAITTSGARAITTNLTVLATGNVLVTYDDYSFDTANHYSFHGRLYDPSGRLISTGFDFEVAEYAAGHATSVTAVPDGGFAIAYEAGPGRDYAIVGQVFDANATAVGTSFAVTDPGDRYVHTPILTSYGTDDLAIAFTYTGSTGIEDSSIKLFLSTIGGTSQSETLTGTDAGDVIRGLAGDDVLNGLAGEDVLIGGAGADTLNGDDDSDTADYSDSDAAVTINLASGTATGGTAQGDVLVSIENITGSAFADTLTGDAGANRIEGGAGNDLLAGGAGADVLVGGDGTDTADYGASGAGIWVDLSAGLGRDGDAAGDTLSGIEVVRGSAFVDVLIGAATADRLEGRGGDDILLGGVNADVLDGGEGSDTASYAGSANRVVVDLSTGSMAGGDAQGDTLISIENLVGSANDDVLTGNAGANRIVAGPGSDTLRGLGGDDIIDGHDGRDVAVFAAASASASLSVLANGDLLVVSAEGRDTLRNVEVIRFADGDIDVSAAPAIDAEYQALGGRAASLSELAYWSGVFTRGGSEADVRNAIIGDALSATAIDATYAGLLERSATSAEIATWRGLFAQGADLDTLRDAIRGEVAINDQIDALYVEYGDRDASAGELNYWRGEIQRGASLDVVRAAIVDDPLGAATIQRSYAELFGRDASAAEVATWRTQFKQGADLATLNGAILDDAAGQAHTDAAIDAIYRDYGGRAASAGEIDSWQDRLANGERLATVKAAIVDDPLGAATIQRSYADLFGRAASTDEVTVWRGLFKSGATVDDLRGAILSEPAGRAYAGSVIAATYRDLGGRDPAAVETAEWLRILAAGGDYGDLRGGILDDPLGDHATQVVRDYYADYFGRAASDAEVAVWRDEFRAGVVTDTLLDVLMTHPDARAGGVSTAAAGPGAQTIAFGSAEHLVVSGFDPAQDMIDLRGSALAGSNPLTRARDVMAIDGRHDVLIDTPTHDLLLTGITLAQLSSSDFFF